MEIILNVSSSKILSNDHVENKRWIFLLSFTGSVVTCLFLFLKLVIHGFFLKFSCTKGWAFSQEFCYSCIPLLFQTGSEERITQRNVTKFIFFSFCNMVQLFSRSPNLNDGLCHNLEYSSSQALWNRKNKKWNMPTKKAEMFLYVLLSMFGWNMPFCLIFQHDRIGTFSFTWLKNFKLQAMQNVKHKKFTLSNTMKNIYTCTHIKLLFQFHFKKKPSTFKTCSNYFTFLFSSWVMLRKTKCIPNNILKPSLNVLSYITTYFSSQNFQQLYSCYLWHLLLVLYTDYQKGNRSWAFFSGFSSRMKAGKNPNTNKEWECYPDFA